MPDREVRDTPGVKLTYDDLVCMPDDGLRHELIDGEHVVSPSPGLSHQTVVMNLGGVLWLHLRHHPVGRVLNAPFDVVFGPSEVVAPDIVYVSHQRARQVLTERRFTGAPDLVVEVASPSTRARDHVLKRDLYERMGVAEYWCIEPQPAAVSVFRRSTAAGGFAAAVVLREPFDILTTPLLPDLQLRLSEIFEPRVV